MRMHIDPELKVALEEMLAQVPGGFNSSEKVEDRRLIAQGNRAEFHLFAGAYHASELFAPVALISQRIWATRIAALLLVLT